VVFIKEVASSRHKLLTKGHDMLDTGVEVVKVLEDNPLFDAEKVPISMNVALLKCMPG